MATSTLATSPVSTPFPLDEEKKPKCWFFNTVEDGIKPHLRMRLLANQFIPFDQELGTYVKGIENWNVKCNRAIRERSSWPAGTIYVSDQIEIYERSGCYNVEEGYMFPLVQASREMREHYENYLNPVVKPKVVIPPYLATPKAGSLLESIKSNPLYAPPKASDGFYVKADMWNHLIRNILVNKNTLVYGPTGTGKTEVFTLLAQRLGLPITFFDMGSMHDPISSLLGTNRLKKKKILF